MTLEELKKYDRAVVKYKGLEGLLYIWEDIVYILNNSARGVCPNFSDEWKRYGYKYSWCIHPDFYHYIELPKPIADFSKLDEILRR